MMQYEQQGDIAIIRIDDGKANAVGHTFIDSMNEHLDRAEKDAKAVVLIGREGMFSAGFDLSEFSKGPTATLDLVKKGFPLFLRLFRHPQPTVVACTGHGIAAGSFIILACDSRLAARGNFKHRLPETAISMTFPPVLHELAANRLSNRFLTQAVIQAKPFNPEQALEAGFVDQLCEPEELEAAAIAEATQLAELPTATYAQNKLDCRAASLAIMEASVNETLASTALLSSE